MKIWVDAHISPGVAAWINQTFPVEAKSLRALNLLSATDSQIYNEAKQAGEIIIVSKDSDFVDLINKYGSPPYLILLRCGNTTNKRVREIFGRHLEASLTSFSQGESIIEIA